MGQLSILGFIAIGGAFGACSISDIRIMCCAVRRGFPYGTLTVNVVGSFIMGLLIAAFENELIATEPWRKLSGLVFSELDDLFNFLYG